MKSFFKKTIAAATAAVMTLSVTAISALAAVGDVNLSGKTNSQDARMLLRYSAHLETLTDEQLAKADLNYDGRVNSSDARILLRAVAKLENLEYYSNFYSEIVDSEGVSMAFGVYNKNVYMETDALGAKLAIVIGADGSFTFIDTANKRYAVLTAAEIKTFETIASGAGESFSFSDILQDESVQEQMTIPKPLKLQEDGYVKNTGTWLGKEVSTYTKGNDVYYYDGGQILGNSTGSGRTAVTIAYKNFTTSPANKIYAHLNGGYAKVDFLEMIMSLSIDF
ncbi:MAG: dockerin type I repeat-containing protein [Clostridia bacterium]|nr:dockerin type I repeat-containing protein [Clostridia bacterium]